MARARKLLLYQFPYYIIVILVTVILLITYVTRSFDAFYVEAKVEDLYARAYLVSQIFTATEADSSADLQSLSEVLSIELNTRITLIERSGKVLIDTHEDPARMDNHADRPEFIGALQEGQASSLRYSYTLEEELLYLAVPIEFQGESAVLRAAVPTTDLAQALSRVKNRIFWGSIVVMLLAVFLSYMFSLRILKPIQTIQGGAQRFTGGELDLRLPEFNIAEINSLSISMNTMAEQLDARLRDLTVQRDETRAVLSSMEEGVIAISVDDQIISMNKAARRMLDIKKKEYKGFTAQEVLRYSELLDFLEKVKDRKKSMSADITVHQDPVSYLRLAGRRMYWDDGEVRGIVLVIDDITRTRHLENIRQEFVANVSHELKTPITSIKGFVETMQADENNQDDQNRRFLDIINRHVDRLNAIINDLLELSRIEEEGSAKTVELEILPLKPLLEKVERNFKPIAEQHKVNLVLEASDDLQVSMNAHLLERALDNLLDNALKFSEAGSTVNLTAEKKKSRVTLSVRDSGPGIAEEHLDRIFERFYRIDKGRSRGMGGTGLGLAIVKHIAAIHAAEIRVDSRPGTGSKFSLIFLT